MTTEIKITAENLDNISAKLDSLGTSLSVDEKGLLASVFQAAALHVHGDVQGFDLLSAHARTGLDLGSLFQGVLGVAGGVTSSGGVDAKAGVKVELPGVGADAKVYVLS